MNDRLSGKVTIVSGGTRGMGEAVVRGIVAAGGQVVLGGRDEPKGLAIAASLGPAARYVRLDVASEDDWRSVHAAAIDAFGRIDGLVNMAGLMGNNPLAETALELVGSLVATNQTSVLLGIKHVVGAMRAAGGGSIVNIGSVAVRRGMAGISAYSGVKAAVAGITRAAAMELAPENIRVNTIHPGVFQTRMLEEAMGTEGITYGAQVTPLGRVAQPEEMVGPIVFLLSDESSFVTGAELSVDGGLSL
jgi:3alpha(or 20beta)-hydroxysteroid dehydrogenase